MDGTRCRVYGDKRSLTVFRALSCTYALILESYRSRLPVGLTGDILINENGDREADYTLNDMDPETGFMVPVATYFGARKVYEEKDGYLITWPSKGNEAPRDVPVCGFEGEAPACRVPGQSLARRSSQRLI